MPLLFLLVTASGAARADDATRARCLALLSAYDTPATAADWRGLGPSAADTLIALAGDATLPPTRRGNAVIALG